MTTLARALALILTLALAACGNPNNGRMQGWIEGDFVFVGPDETGRVETLSVREGDQVAAGAPLFRSMPTCSGGREHDLSASGRSARTAAAA